MSSSNDERQRDHPESLSPLSNRFLVAHSSPVHDHQSDTVPRAHDESFQSSSSTSNSKSSSSTTSRSSRLQVLLMQHHHNHHSAVNSPLMYSRCTSLGSLASYDIRSSCNESYTSECSSVKPSGLISPSDIPDSPPCEPEILVDEETEEHQQQQRLHPPTTRPVNRTLTMNTTSSHNRTTMMSETVIEKTFIYQHQPVQQAPQHTASINNPVIQLNDVDEDEHLDEVIVYSYETTEMHQHQSMKTSYSNDLIFDDDSYRIFTAQIDENESLIEEMPLNEASFQDIVDSALPHENLSVITEESSFVEEFTSNDENNSIRILYDLIKKPHWTQKTQAAAVSAHPSIEDNSSISSNPSSLSLDSISGHQSDDEEDYDQEKGRQLIQRLIAETLARRSLRTDFLHSTSCSLSSSKAPLPATTARSGSFLSIKSCTCSTNKTILQSSQSQRSQSSPARASATIALEDIKRPVSSLKTKEKIVPQTRTSVLRLRQAQQNKRAHQPDKRI